MVGLNMEKTSASTARRRLLRADPLSSESLAEFVVGEWLFDSTTVWCSWRRKEIFFHYCSSISDNDFNEMVPLLLDNKEAQTLSA